MAELNVKVVVKREDFDKFQADITKLKNEVKEIKIDVTAVQKAIKSFKDLEKGVADVTRAEAKYNDSLAKVYKAENEAYVIEKKRQIEAEKTAQSVNRVAAAETKAAADIVRAEQRTQQELLKTERAVTRTAGTWQKMFSMFSLSNIVSSGVTRAISSMRSYFNEALEEMKQLDLAATHYMQVMGDQTTPEKTSALTKQAYSVGSKYGTSASDYMESVATYARAGYKDVSDQLAELSMKTVIVGQTTQDVADQFLLTMDTAYKYEGSVKELSKVLDGASAIDSNYATTIEKIATGLGLVAPLAEQVHTSEAELTAAIGTITAATQRSGAEAARALRSLFLNIIKDTTTEIEDGVTATEESVASVQYLLEKYAHSAVEAARATGQVVNPMEAIGALAQSMKEGLLTEAELMDLLSGIGGKLRISQLVALISNWDMYTDMIGTYEHAMGSADEKVTIYLDSWEAKTNILKNTWTEFIANTIDSKTIKGLVDAATKFLKIVGDLGSALKTLGGVIVAIKLGSKAAELSNLARISQESANIFIQNASHTSDEVTKANNLIMASEKQKQAVMQSSNAMIMNWAMVGVAAITTIITAYNAYHNKRLEQLKQEQDEAVQDAQAQKEQADKLSKLYDIYYNAKKAYEDGTVSIEAYESAVRNLCEALDIQYKSLDDVIGKIQEKTEAEMQASIDESEAALRAARATASYELGKINPIASNPIKLAYEFNYEKDDNGQWHEVNFTDEERLDHAIAKYKELNAVKEEYLKGGDVSKKDYQDAVNWMAEYESYLGIIISLEKDLDDTSIDLFQTMLGIGDELTTDELAESLGLTAENAEDAANAIDNVTASLEKYKTATKTELDTDFKSYADAWWKAWEDIEAGRTNSNLVNAAGELLLSDQQRLELYKQGISIADELGKPFWQQVFSYVDEEGVRQSTKGEDAGSLLGWYMYENFTDEAGNILDKNNEIVASFEEVDGALNINVEDFDALSEALSELKNVDLDPTFLEVAFQAMGIFANEAYITAGMAEELAKQLGVLDDKGRINIDMIVPAALANGWTKQQVDDLLESLGLLEEKGEVELVFNPEGIDAASQKAEQLAEKKHEVNVEDNSDEVTEHLSEIQFEINVVTQDGEPYTIKFTTNETDVIGQMNNIRQVAQEVGLEIASMTAKHTTSANGQRNFRGGLSLVNEQAPELIVEGSHARIAGNGSPTLTYLAKGADVYTAQETKAILGGSYPTELFDGINAYAGGTVTNVQRWTPPSSGKDDNGGNATSGGDTGGDSGSGKNSDKDPQLEALKDRIDLLKSELNLMKERGDSLDKQIAKQREIQAAYQAEIEYLKSIGGDQKEINDLSTQWWKIENDITDALKKQKEEEEKKEKERQEKEKKRQEHYIDWYEKKASLAKAELDLLEANDAPIRQQVEKQREISNWYRKEINYLKKIGGHQEDILKLEKQRKDVEKDIAELNQSMMDDLGKAVNQEIKNLNAKRDKEIASVQKRIDKLKEEKEAQDKVNEAEEKHQALVEAWRKLRNVRQERTVRQYNAKTKQWEWVADANAVASAKDEWNSAKQSWSEYKAEQRYESKIAGYEARQEEITKKYQEQTDKWQKILDALEDPVITIAEALKNIEKNATKDQKSEIKTLNKLLKPLGYSISTKGLYDSGGILSGVGGIKGTRDDEMVLPPDVTKKLLKPMQPANFTARMNELRYLYGAGGGYAGLTNNSIGSQHNGDLYTFGSITLTESVAKQTTLYDFVQASKGLRAYNGTM